MNTRDDVVGMSLTHCDRITKKCDTVDQKWSYAIPLEIVYTTPLSKWNPYGLHYQTKRHAAAAGGRNGSPEMPYNGTDIINFYQTPAGFYTGKVDEADPADTSIKSKWAVDPEGKAWEVMASGHKIIVPEITGVGRMRQRWPIAPFAQEGSMIKKELDAIKEILFNPDTYQGMFN